MNDFHSSSARTTRQSGFSMLEVMISIVIASIGLLGLASMQATGLKNSHSAYHRSQATVLAYDLADRMRANMGSINAYLTDLNITLDTTPDVVTQSGPTGCKSGSGCSSIQIITDPIIDPVIVPVVVDLSGCTSTSGCSSDELAAKDLLDWNSDLTAAIPGAVGTVTLTGNIYTISISWDDNRDGAIDGNDPNFRVSFQL